MVENKKRILVLGGGFAGIECTRKLESYFIHDVNIQITLVSEDNFFLFTPMLPQVASGMIETRHIITPIRTLFVKTEFYESKIKNIDPYGKIVTLEGTSERRGISLEYDFLVLALGSQTNFFVIDGAGFAGVETAGELIDFVLDARKHYPHITREDIRVIILEAVSFILPGFDAGLAKFALKKLTQRGIEVKLNTKLSSFSGTEVIIEDVTASMKNPVNQPNI